MKTLRELQEERGQKHEAAQTLVTTAENEQRDMNDDEKTKFDGYMAEIDQLDKDIARAQRIENMQANQGQQRQKPEGGESNEIRKNFNLRKMFAAAVTGKTEGFEAEMHQEAENEARQSGMELRGVGVPLKALKNTEQRAAILAGAAADGTGEGLVRNRPVTFIDELQSQFMGSQLGMQVVTGLQGRVNVGRGKDFAASWTAENTANNTTTGATDRYEMYPHRLTALSQLSKQLILQDGDSEAVISRQLINAINAALMAAAINGSGSSGQPEGLLNATGVGQVVAGDPDGATLTFADVVNLEGEVKTDAGMPQNLAYLTNSALRSYLKKTAIETGDSARIWMNGEMNGRAAYSNDQVPDDLSKGSSGDTLSALLFGNWQDLWVGQWGGMDIIADPYSAKKSGLIELQVDTFWDVFVKQPKSFAKIIDAALQ
jgi:HK97 family phage major capsid protein